MPHLFPPWSLERCFLTPELLPPLLYYVRHGTSQTLFGPTGDIHTQNPDKSLRISSRDELELLVRAHLDWSSRGSCFFISTFFDEREARRWGLEREPMAVMYTIDTRRLPVPWPVVCAGVHTQNTFDADFLFLSHIPSQAIVRIDTILPHRHVPQDLAAVDDSVLSTPSALGFVPPPPPPPYIERSITPPGQWEPSPEIPSPPQYSAPQHFTSPPYTTPAQYITPVPSAEPPIQVPPAASIDGTRATSDPGDTRVPGSDSSSPPHIPPEQIMPGQLVESPSQLPPQLQNKPTVPEPPVLLGADPFITSSVSDPDVESKPGPEVNPDVTAAPEPGTPIGNPETPVQPVQSVPVWVVQSNPATPLGMSHGINFFADYLETPESFRSDQAGNSNPGTPTPAGLGNINFFAED